MKTIRCILPPLAPLHACFLLFIVWILKDMMDEWSYREYQSIEITNPWLWVAWSVQCGLNTVRQYKQLSTELTLVTSTTIRLRFRCFVFFLSICLSVIQTSCTYFLIVFGVFVRPMFMYTWLFGLFVGLYIYQCIHHTTHKMVLRCQTT